MQLIQQNNLRIQQAGQAVEKLNSYPESVQPYLVELRNIILEVAEETLEILEITETLKWGELSYLTKTGSTVRIDWKAKAPDFYAIYFKCTSKLVATFKEVFPTEFRYDQNRAILFQFDEKIPIKELKTCIKTALLYHKVKTKPLLGLTS